MKKYLSILLVLLSAHFAYGADNSRYWHGIERELRYTPDGEEFVIINGDKRFTRAIYGTNTGFRFETSDFPEFGLYMPYLGGSVYMAVSTPGKTVWVKDLEYIESRFRSGERTYILKDSGMLGEGSLMITAVALSDGDGLVVKYTPENVPDETKLIWVYGGANNKRFSREGDIGADPADSFYIKPANCEKNIFDINNNAFSVYYGYKEEQPKKVSKPEGAKEITGVFPAGTVICEADGNKIDELDALLSSGKSERPVIVAEHRIGSGDFYFELHNPASRDSFGYDGLAEAFDKGVRFRTEIASVMKVNTPDPFFNTLGGIFSGAQDAVWEEPGYLHGAIGWRMPLTGWRGAYLADLMGMHERARKHFDGYAASQITDTPATLPHLQDSTLNLARSAKIWGTPMYSDGYICRSPNKTNQMHHYDMNLVYIDQLLWHLNWTGDMEYAKEVFPVIERHLAWEKSLFDPDNDGLYDSYACIWASDGLQYNGGKGTHSTAYNYRANKMAAEIARKIGEDPTPYEKEAELILSAVNEELWIEGKGWWAEFKDNMGHRMRHENPGIWTIYHAIDSDIHDPFKAYQATRYVDTELAHIPVLAKNLEDSTNYVVATTNWQPYMWSINNVAFAETAHTALAYWQAGRSEEAFKMYKGAVLDAMYLGSGPGNITQVSFYDAARGEMYRDFADPVAMVVRAMVQGMFGIIPDLTNRKLTVRPGLPADWDFADMETRNMMFSFRREGNLDIYEIKPALAINGIELTLEVSAVRDKIASVKVNGKESTYSIEESILTPKIIIPAGIAEKYDIEIEWAGGPIDNKVATTIVAKGENASIPLNYKPENVFDPQGVFESDPKYSKGGLNGIVAGEKGSRTIFVKARRGDMKYWHPVDIVIVDPVEITYDAESSKLDFSITNNMGKNLKGRLYVNIRNTVVDLNIPPGGSAHYSFDAPVATMGTNKITIKDRKDEYQLKAINWNIQNLDNSEYTPVVIKDKFNDKVRDIFAYGKYLSPRWEYTTLQVPTQGMGQWCHPGDLSVIDDSGIRKAAANDGIFVMPQGVPFATPGGADDKNIIFTTLWDNYLAAETVPLAGKASKAYLLVAGSTYHMQAHVLNGRITVKYKDGSEDVLELVLPENLIPLDQDIFIDGWAFDSKEPRPWRVRLQTAEVSKYHAGDIGKRMSNNPIYVDGGMATMLDITLDPDKELDSLSLETTANEVVIGLMSVTLMK